MIKNQRLRAPSMPSQDAIDKRSYRRLPRPYPVEAKRLSLSANKDPGMETTCCDISKGGLCVEARSPFTKGDVYQLRVLIPMLNKFSSSFFKVYENDAEQYLMALAEVAWVKPAAGSYLIGFRFVNVDESQSQALERLIAKAFASAAE